MEMAVARGKVGLPLTVACAVLGCSLHSPRVSCSRSTSVGLWTTRATTAASVRRPCWPTWKWRQAGSWPLPLNLPLSSSYKALPLPQLPPVQPQHSSSNSSNREAVEGAPLAGGLGCCPRWACEAGRRKKRQKRGCWRGGGGQEGTKGQGGSMAGAHLLCPFQGQNRLSLRHAPSCSFAPLLLITTLGPLILITHPWPIRCLFLLFRHIPSI